MSGPGRFASEAFVWAAVVSILATFRITKAKDADGKEIDVKRQFTTGLAVYVIMNLPFQFKIDGTHFPGGQWSSRAGSSVVPLNERTQSVSMFERVPLQDVDHWLSVNCEFFCF